MLAEVYMTVKEDQHKYLHFEKRALGGILAAGALAASSAAARDQPNLNSGAMGEFGFEKPAEVIQQMLSDFDTSDSTQEGSTVGKQVSSFVLDTLKEAIGINDAISYVDLIVKFLKNTVKLALLYTGLGIFLKYGLSFLLKQFVNKFLLKKLDDTKDRLTAGLPNKVQQEIAKLENLEQTDPQQFAKRVDEIQKRCEATLDKKLEYVGISQFIIMRIHKYIGKTLASTSAFKIAIFAFFCHILIKYGVNIAEFIF